MKSKKARIGAIQGIVITLMIIGLILGIGFLVLEEFEDTLGTTVTTVANESIIVTDAGSYTSANSTSSSIFCFNSFAITDVLNGTTTGRITSGNYSYEAATGRIINLTTTFSDSLNTWNISYTYQSSTSEACQGIESTVDAMNEIPTWLTIIVIILIVGILLTIVFKVLPTNGESGNMSYGGSGGSGITAEI